MSLSFRTSSWASWGAMSMFVLLWGSAAIFTRWALDHGSPSAVLLVRYGAAFAALLDYAVLGNLLAPMAVVGMLCILAGVILVHRRA